MKHILLAGLLSLGLHCTAQASIIVSYSFTGTVTSVTQFNTNVLDGSGIGVGDAITGSLTYNDMPSSTFNDSGGKFSFYEFNSGFAVSVAIETHMFNSDDASPFNVINILNNTNFDGDAFDLDAQFALLPIVVPGIGERAIRIKLQDSTETVFNDTSLPLSLDLNNFDNAGGSIISAAGSSNFYTIGFSIDTLTPVPEASSIVVWGIGGMVALAGSARRRKRRQAA